MTADEDNVEETVMLTRRDRRRAGAKASAESTAAPGAEDARPSDDARPLDDEATIVVARSSLGAVDAADTVGPADDDSASVDEATVVVSRPQRRARRARRADESVAGESAADESAAGDSEGAHRPADAAAEPFAAPAGPTPSIYKPRPAPQGASAPPVVVGAMAPTRTDDPERPSVAKQARRWSVLTLAALAAACVISVAGLVGVGFLALG